MRDRVFGIETEYALIYHPARGERRRPTNLELWPFFEQALEGRVASLPRAFSLLRAKPGRFLENGASFHYEATPQAFEHGLLEMASPECRDPFTLLAHERAKDRLAELVAGRVSARLRRLGYEGEVRVGKNNVDSQGHTFGSHESYWVDDPLAPGRRVLLAPVWLLLWLVTLPALTWLLVASAGVALALLGLALGPAVGAATVRAGHLLARRLPGAGRNLARRGWRLRIAATRTLRQLVRHPGELPRRLAWLEAPLVPLLALHSRVYDAFHFRRIRRDATAFLVTRTVFAGAGAVRPGEGAPLVRLAQRPPFLRAVSRIFTHGDARPLFESRDVFFRPWSAFGSRRRLHLLLGDANLCDWALVLRVGATALVLEALESGAAVRWPRLVAPLAALRAVNEDDALTREIPLAWGGSATALAVQRRYLEGVRAALGDEIHRVAWKRRVFAMWEETLDALARDPAVLADRVDWIAKRALVEDEVPDPDDRRALERRGRALLEGPPADAEARRLRPLAFRALRADLRYHELGPRGGHRRLCRLGRVRELVSDVDVERALFEPPADTRAAARGRAIREASRGRTGGAATWHRVRVGWRSWRIYADPLAPRATLLFDFARLRLAARPPAA